MQPSQALIAILYYSGEPVSFKNLAKITGSTEELVRESLSQVSDTLASVGLTVIMTVESAELRTSKETTEIIDAMRKEELSRDLGKAALETLSILVYKGPSTRADVDYIRGVNSTAILRNLMIRGLVDKVANPSDQRSFLYRPTHDLLAHLGVSKIEEMAEYSSIKSELELFNASQNEESGVIAAP